MYFAIHGSIDIQSRVLKRTFMTHVGVSMTENLSLNEAMLSPRRAKQVWPVDEAAAEPHGRGAMIALEWSTYGRRMGYACPASLGLYR